MSDFRKALQVGAAKTGIKNPLSSFGVDGQQMSSEPQMPKPMLRNPMSGEIIMANIASNEGKLFGVCRQGRVWLMTDGGWELIPMHSAHKEEPIVQQSEVSFKPSLVSIPAASPEPTPMLTPVQPIQDVSAPTPHPIEVPSTQVDIVVPIEMHTIQTPIVEVVEYDPSKDPDNSQVVEYDPSKDPDNQ